jgi:excisionase family DNA binding protein
MPTDTPTVERLAYSAAEVAEAVGCSTLHIRNLIARGDIPAVRLGRRVLIRRAVLEDLLDGDDAA